jgi:hypothetical protein
VNTLGTSATLRFSEAQFAERERDAERQFKALRAALDLNSVFLDIGAGDCVLSRRVAGYVERVYALDITDDLMGRLGGPPNLVRMMHDGVRIPLPQAEVDVAFSRNLTISQLPGICHALKDGGTYFTSSKGPAAELREVFFDAGFSKLRFYVGAVRVPYLLACVLDDTFRIAATK